MARAETHMMSASRAGWPALALLALWGCGEAEDPYGAEGAPSGAGGAGYDACLSDEDCGEGYSCFSGQCLFQGGDAPPTVDAGVGSNDEERPPVTLPPPAVEGTRIWVAQPGEDTVARIDAETRAVEVVEVGLRPTIVRPTVEGVAVLNHGSDEISLVKPAEDISEVRHLPLPAHFNALEVTPAGHYALAWFDAHIAEPGEPAQARQTVMVIQVETGAMAAMAVGFNPRQVLCPEGDVLAVVVTDDGLSIIDLPPPGEPLRAGVAPSVPLATSAWASADREVKITPDGAVAVSAAIDEAGLTVVRLDEGLPRFVELGATPTDFEVSPLGDEAWVATAEGVFRVGLAAEPLVVPVALPLSDLDALSIGGDGRYVVAFSTTQPQPAVAVIERASGAAVARRLPTEGVGPVAGAQVGPGGRRAWLWHHPGSGPEPTYGWTLMDLETLYARLQPMPSPPEGPIFDPDGRWVMVAQHAPEPEVMVADLEAFEVTRWPLGAAPEAMGVLPGSRQLFVTQVDPAGRVSFIDPSTGGQSVVGGYVLNQGVR